MGEATAPVRTISHWIPATGGMRYRRATDEKGRVGDPGHHKRPRRLAAPASKIRWVWWRRYHTRRPYVCRGPGLLADAAALRDLMDSRLLLGLDQAIEAQIVAATGQAAETEP